jgi:splicing factor 3B subunit 3
MVPSSFPSEKRSKKSKTLDSCLLRLPLLCSRLDTDALLQVHPHGIRHVSANRKVNEWRVPQGKTIVAATTNKRQVVVALSSAELVYFELDLEGQLNEYQDRKAMGSTVLALSIGEVPEGTPEDPLLGMF